MSSGGTGGLAGEVSRRQSRWLAAQFALAIAVLAIAAFFTFASPSTVTLVRRFAPASLGDQPSGAVVLAREDGSLAVGIAVAPRVHGLLVVATIFSPTGGGAPDLRARVTVTGRDGTTASGTARACATTGCYEAVLAFKGLPERAALSLGQGTPLVFTLPKHGPSVDARHLIALAEAEYKRIRTMVTYEKLASSPTAVAYTTYYAVAPDRLRFTVRGEDQSIIIGDQRWDRSIGGRWEKSRQSPVNPISPYWAPLVQDPTILGTTTVRGQPITEISFADPQTPGFFTIWVNRRNDRTVRLVMTAAGHFMHHTYARFNAAISVQPPRTR